ncbi:MAG: GDP-mannose 4,6-dehydratase, partial [Candidatus Rokuibacteriota bacterium]
MRLLITGITGFVGSHLADQALAHGATVVGSLRRTSKLDNLEHVRDRIELVEADLEDVHATRRLVEAARPDWVVHLAAQSSASASWKEPAETLRINTVCQINVLEVLRTRPGTPRCLVIGSSDEYGFVRETELPITEDSPLRPLSPYAVSKVA